MKKTSKKTKTSKPKKKGTKKGGDDVRDEKGRIKKGTVLNPTGRPKGALSFATKWRRAMEKIAMQNETTVDELEIKLFIKSYQYATKGNYKFYADILDRLYGKATQNINVKNEDEEDPIEKEARIQQEIKEMEEWEKMWFNEDNGNQDANKKTKGKNTKK